MKRALLYVCFLQLTACGFTNPTIIETREVLVSPPKKITFCNDGTVDVTCTKIKYY
ncbi:MULTISPECIES: hypothetical protein [Legionella]|uniref:hypothetical protein n=1 Tax=Legionella TaxID=445 RepID=UPI0013157646|nr:MULTISPECIES: hypothetical protein [Legionella]MCP0913993.1 hypothetical protein [Legionella sp. 27cVA30]